MTLAAVALGDALTSRSIASVRNVLFLLIAGTSCVVMTGLPEVFFPALPDRLMMVLKAGLGPLAGAMGLYFIGIGLGVVVSALGADPAHQLKLMLESLIAAHSST